MINRHFKPIMRYFRRDDPPMEVVTIRLESQLHEIIIPAPLGTPPASQAHLTPMQRFHMEVISALQDRARAAYTMVIGAGISAVSGQPYDQVKFDPTIDMALETKDREIAILTASNLAHLKQIDKLEAQIEALERVISRKESDRFQAQMRRDIGMTTGDD